MSVPIAQAMIVCDAVHRDPGTGKIFLLGTFSTLYTRTIPFKHPQMCLFLVMTECKGTTPILVRLVRVDHDTGEDESMAVVKGKLESPDPLAVHEMVLQFKDVTFGRPGEYRFQLESDGEPLLEKRLVVQSRG
jgi:hypothetical protein